MAHRSSAQSVLYPLCWRSRKTANGDMPLRAYTRCCMRTLVGANYGTGLGILQALHRPALQWSTNLEQTHIHGNNIHQPL